LIYDQGVTQLNPGDQLDHYYIESVVASGGMASIFRANDVRTGRPVALKVPHPQAESDPVFYDRFNREAEIGKKLDHPAVVKVLHHDRRKRLYMATEWAEGRLLRQILAEEGRLSFDRAAWITMEVCVALEYLHSQGVVHRDLKPENIIVDAEDRIKIIDFGIASTVGARRLTFGKLSEVMGSPDYISPEQIKGKRGDARSDLFALGVILYEMLTGQVPFTGPNVFAVMHDRVVNHPTPPREINPAISPQLQEIVYRALERDPKSRYASAHEFAWDLSHQDQVGVEDRTELADWKKRRSPWNRNVFYYAMLAVIPVAVVGLLLYVARHS
jgi:serine/threonine-protein kinase